MNLAAPIVVYVPHSDARLLVRLALGNAPASYCPDAASAAVALRLGARGLVVSDPSPRAADVVKTAREAGLRVFALRQRHEAATVRSDRAVVLPAMHGQILGAIRAWIDESSPSGAHVRPVSA